MNSLQKAKYLIENNEHMTIATADTLGKPWVSPVFFMHDDKYNLYWVSNKDALHSQNIKTRSEIAIVIFGQLQDNGVDGVYIDAIASELQDDIEINEAIRILAKRPQPTKFTIQSIVDVTGNAVWRIYKAIPIAVSKRADATIKGQAVTVRESIKF